MTMDKTSLPRYKYKPLCAADAVRVLVLKPTQNSSDPLSCEIIQYSRSEFLRNPNNDTHYTAVSYTWGGLAFSRHIFCDGNSSILEVTPNVDSLLRHLRKAFKPRYLWIDAICLDQANAAEKAVQIPLMGEIYTQARKVRIWLGEGDKESAMVFAFLRTASSIRLHGPDFTEWLLDQAQSIFGNRSTAPIEEFLCRSWFSRRWILQEAKLARQATVHCGNDTIPWPWLASSFSILRGATRTGHVNFQLSPEALEALNAVYMLSRTSRPHLLHYLWHFHSSECRDVQDRIFSLYGMLSDEDRNVPVTYTSSWTDICQEHALACFRAGQANYVLSHLFAFGPLNSGNSTSIPSWVPDWSGRRQKTLFWDQGEPTYDVSAHHPRFTSTKFISKVSDLGSSALELRFPAVARLEDGIIIKLPLNSKWKDVTHAFSSVFVKSPSRPFLADITNLIVTMLELNMHAGFLNECAAKFTAETKQVSSETEDSFDIVLSRLKVAWEFFHDEDFQWSSAQIYLLDALCQLLQDYTLFYQRSPFGYQSFLVGFGPPSIQEGSLISPLSLIENEDDIVNSLTLIIGDQFEEPKPAIALQLVDEDIIRDSHADLRRGGRKARIIGPCLCCFSYSQFRFDAGFTCYLG